MGGRPSRTAPPGMTKTTGGQGVRMGGEEEGERRGVGARSKILGRGRKKFISTEGEGRVDGGSISNRKFFWATPEGRIPDYDPNSSTGAAQKLGPYQFPAIVARFR